MKIDYELLKKINFLEQLEGKTENEMPISDLGLTTLINNFVSDNQDCLCINYIWQKNVLEMPEMLKIQEKRNEINAEISAIEDKLFQNELAYEYEKQVLREQLDILNYRDKELSLKEFYFKSNDFLCEKILKLKKNEKLNFFVIFGTTIHASIVLNIHDSYFFINSISTFEKIWPSKELIDNIRFKENEIFNMESCLQRDDFNCRSFCFEFIKNLTEKYKSLDKNIISFHDYLKLFFCYKNEKTKIFSEKPTSINLFIEEKNELYGTITLSLLPIELLKLCQSFTFLTTLKEKILNSYNEIYNEYEKLKKQPLEENKLKEIEENQNNIEEQIEIIKNNFALFLPKNIPENLEEKKELQEINKARNRHLSRLSCLAKSQLMQQEKPSFTIDF